MTPTPTSPERTLERLTRRAAWALAWERVWPPLAWGGTVALLFLAASWLGLWFVTPGLWRWAALAVFILALAAALAPLALFRWPTRAQTLERLDRDARDGHRPASGFEDALANKGEDATTRALWDLHRARLARRIEALRLDPPSPGMALRDPRALRFGAILIAVAAGLSAGPERYGRVAAAFLGPSALVAEAGARVDAWIDPPPYANKPPLLLKVAGQEKPEDVTAPEESVLIVRADPGRIVVGVEGAIEAKETKAPAPAKGVEERRFTIKGDGAVHLGQGVSTLASFKIHVTPKGQPTIALLDPPQANLSGSLTLHYSIADAYGVANAEATFARPGAAPAHSLAEPPKFALSLPSGANGTGEARTTSDLAEHPWAGAEVTMILRATDVGGASGASAPVTMKLPQRAFVNPLAKALVEQRRDLILDPDRNRPRLAKALEALLIAPESFDVSPSVYLGLRGAQALLTRAAGDKDLLGVAEYLWAMALQIEDGDASQAQRDLRAAEEKLREALKKGASEEEIKKLSQELRQAVERYMAEMMRQTPNATAEDAPMDSRDLDAMLNQMEESAKSGARDEAQAMLDQLQNMMENMRNGRDAANDPAAKELQKQLSELDKMLRDQQTLRDDTFKQDQRERSGKAEPEGQPKDSPSLAERQQQLRDRIEEMKKRLKALGLKGEKGFDDAEGAMSEAERSLKGEGQSKPEEGNSGPGGSPGKGAKGKPGRTDKGDAVEAQGRALQAMREGAQGLQQQMQGKGGQGKSGFSAVGRNPGNLPGRDPLGRGPNGSRGSSEGQLHEGAEASERARRVLQELRRRLADPNRPGDERDYLERLLGRE